MTDIVSVNIITLPNNGGAPITDLEYRVNAGAAISLGETTTGSYPITADEGDDIEIRAVNAIGAGDWSDVKAVPSGVFDPATLFASGEQGAWYDPSDLSTMFTDTAGTTPATVGSAVGLLLDKSQGLELGPELVTNGGPFVDTTGWAAVGGSLSTVEGWLRLTASGFPSFASTSFATVAGKSYKLSGDWRTGGKNWRIIVGTTSGGSTTFLATAGTSGSLNEIVFVAEGSTTFVSLRSAVVVEAGDFAEVNNISVRELRGNHATQATVARRPILRQLAGGQYYLEFDGVDDALVTPTITPGVDKAQVFAGVRKLTDAAGGQIIALSGNGGGNDGTFRIMGPAAGGESEYQIRSRGTVLRQALFRDALVAAPVTNVLAFRADISAPLLSLRIDGVSRINNINDQGTGNFLAYPAFIGAVAGTSEFFNGHIYSLIVRFGANLDTPTIETVEGFVANKTGITL